ncbi:MAG: biotin/lipoyl-containing protein, partial [Gammaproteobacteria bacterium]
MSVEIKVPLLPESVADATMLRWHVKVGQPIRRDENMVDIETEKVVLEVPAPKDGVITQILRNEGDTVLANDVIALFDEGVAANDEKDNDGGEENNEAVNAPTAPASSKADESEPKGSSSPSNVSAPSPAAGKHQTAKTPKANAKPTASPSGPAAKSAARERGVELAEVKGSGRGGRILKEDVLTHSKSPVAPGASAGERQTRREPMSRLRKTIAGRLLNAQQEAAILTTFNEVDLHEV